MMNALIRYALLACLYIVSILPALANPAAESARAGAQHSISFPVIEFRRYTISEGERENFARYFDSYFPEAFQQLGAMPFGQFLDRGSSDRFTWLRGFTSTEARAVANSAFYYGPLWKEHASKMNSRLLDHTNVLLLQPVSAEHAIPALPAVDPVQELEAARGVVLALLMPTTPEQLDQLVNTLAPAFTTLRASGVRDAGLLSTLDVANSFPQLPFRTDGHWLVWLGLVETDQKLQQLMPPIARLQTELKASQLLRAETELLVLDPTARSRLRWLP